LGLRCKIKDGIKKNDILWLSFDRATLNICGELEKKAFIYQNGVIGKVVWIKPTAKKSYEVGIRFITRQEKNLSNIYPKIHFLEQGYKLVDEEEEEEAAEGEVNGDQQQDHQDLESGDNGESSDEK